MDNPSVLVLSSLVFTTNVATAFYLQEYVYSLLFQVLTLTSVVVHSNNNIYTNVIDKFAVLSVVLYGGNKLWEKVSLMQLETIHLSQWLYLLAIFLTFYATVHLYVYGFFVGEYCWFHETDVQDFCHVLVHFISSLGHHMILYL